MLKASPDPVDVQDFQFKLHCKLKVFENAQIGPFSKPCSLVAASNVYGLLFVGAQSSIQVVRCCDMDQLTVKDGEKNDFLRRNVTLSGTVRHLSVNCDSSLLAAVLELDNRPVVHFYDVKSFCSQNVAMSNRLQLSSTPGTAVLEVNWNPTVPEVFTACKGDGSLGVYEVKKDISINELPPEAGATCFCWSPKGKQLAVGSRDGKITQYKPDLKAVRVINPPPLQEAHSVLSLQWISNYQFIGVYITSSADPSANLIVVDAPKMGEVSYTTYDDICYSNSPVRPIQFYMIHEPQWNLLMVASSNSMEVGVLHNVGDSWTQLTLIDSARAELPLSSDHCDTLPVGFSFSTCSTEPIPWGEGTIPPSPKLFLFSHYGVLCCFSAINLKENIPSICAPPTKLEPATATLFTRDVTSISSSASGTAKSFAASPILQSNKSQDSPLIRNSSGVKDTGLFAGFQSMVQSTGVSQIITTKESSISHPATGLFQQNQSSFQLTSKPSQTNINVPQQNANVFQQSTTALQENKNVLQQSMNIFQQNTNSPQQSSELQINANLVPQNTSIFHGQLVKSASNLSVGKAATEPTATPLVVSKPQRLVAQKQDADLITETQTNLLTEKLDLNDQELSDLLARIIKEECVALESELNVLLHQAHVIKVELGTEEEKNIISESTCKLEEFLTEVVNNYTLQKSDVHILKQNLLQTWAWLEEARSRQNTCNDGTIAALLRAMPLDSAAEKQLNHIRHLMYYLDSQLKQAHDALDDQWENFQDYCKKTHRMQLPTMETVFQTMVRHNATLNKLSYNLKDISSRIKSQKQIKNKSTPLVATDSLRKLEETMEQMSIGPQDVYKIHYERITNKLLSPNKTGKLRRYLKESEVKSISSYKVSVDQSSSLMSKLKNAVLSNKASFAPPQISKTPSKQLDFSFIKPENTTPKIDLHAPTARNAFQTGLLPREPPASSRPQSSGTTYIPSAFVPTTISSNLVDSTGQINLKGMPTPRGRSTPVKSILPSTTASAFSISAAPKSAFSNTIELGPSTVAPTTSTTTGGNLTPSPQVSFHHSTHAKPLNFTTGVVGSGSPVIVFDANTSNASTPKTTGFKLSNEITLTKTSAAKPPFNLPSSEIQITKVIATTPAATSANFSGFVGITVGKTFTTPTKPTFENPNLTAKPESQGASIVKPSSSTTNAVVSGNVATTASSLQALRFNVPGTTVQASDKDGSVLFKAVSKPTDQLFTAIKASPAVTSPQFGLTPLSSKTSIFDVSSAATSTVSVTVTQTTTDVPQSNLPDEKTTISQSTGQSTPFTALKQSISDSDTAVSASSSASIFSAVPSAVTTTTQSSIFGGSKSSLFSLPASSAASTTPQTNVPSIFGVVSTTKTTDSGTKTTLAAQNFSFGTATTSSQGTVPTASTQSSIFSSVPAPPAQTIFGTTPTAVSSQSSIFASNTSTAAQNPLFGSCTTNTTVSSITSPKPSLFGAPVQPTTVSSTTKGSIFGTSQTTAPSAQGQVSIFGTSGSTPAVSSSQQKNIFGAPQNQTTSATTQSSIFGGAQVSSFGIAVSATSQPSVFGSFQTTTASIFGNTPSTSSSLFGKAADTPSSPFGLAPGKSIFGNASTPSSFAATTTSVSPFSVQSSTIFGTAQGTMPSGNESSTFSPQSTSFGGFGATPATSVFQSSPFGTVLTSSTNSSNLNVPSSSGIGTTSSAFVNLTPAQFAGQPSSQSMFGTPASTSSNSFSFSPQPGNTGFGFGNLNMGSTTTSSNAFGASANPFAKTSVFGTPSTQPSSLFGSGVAATQSSSIFGSNPASSQTSSIFGGSTGTPSTQSSVFGSGSAFGSPVQSGFGSQPAFGAAPVFGQQAAFSQSTFGSSSGGPFSGGTSSVSQSGFGEPPSFPKPGGFGSPPAFGTAPAAFGASPSFGGAPTFGSSPTFGSPDKVFGGSPVPGGFQPPSQENPTFANLANQNTIGFGSLAQQAQNPSGSPFSGSSSFTSWR